MTGDGTTAIRQRKRHRADHIVEHLAGGVGVRGGDVLVRERQQEHDGTTAAEPELQEPGVWRRPGTGGRGQPWEEHGMGRPEARRRGEWRGARP